MCEGARLRNRPNHRPQPLLFAALKHHTCDCPRPLFVWCLKWRVRRLDEVLAPPRVRCVARRPGGGRKRPACEAVTVRHTAFSADGTHLVGGCDDGSVYIWRLGAAVEEAAE